MKIIINNDQSKIKLKNSLTKIIKKTVQLSAAYLEFPTKIEVGITIVDNEKIKELNLCYRDINAPTDVLSFPMLAYDENHNIIDQQEEQLEQNGHILLGDIVISIEKAQEQSKEYKSKLEYEIAFLTVHSMLHLFGYDHQTLDDETEMFEIQYKILDRMKV